MEESNMVQEGMRLQIRRQIESLTDLSYKQFSSKLLPGTERIVGVRLPLLRKLARQSLKKDWKAYLEEVFGLQKSCKDDVEEEFFEEIMFQGILIGYAPLKLEEKFFYLDKFIPKIDNWSVCDSVCTTMKFAKEYPEETWGFLRKYVHSDKEYGIRFAVVMYINYFIREDYFVKVLEELNEISHPAYYVKMAVAWAVSMCYVFNAEETEVFLNTCKLDDFTYNKTIQKIIESRQVEDKEKERIRGWKRKSTVKQ